MAATPHHGPGIPPDRYRLRETVAHASLASFGFLGAAIRSPVSLDQSMGHPAVNVASKRTPSKLST